MKYNIIAIEREFASGGREIGKTVAENLEIPFYGIEILETVAQRYGVSIEDLHELEETTTNSFLYSISLLSKLSLGNIDGLSKTDALYLAETKIIKEFADKGPCVIIGRCAGCILEDRKDVLKVFVYSDWDTRKIRATQKYGISPSEVDSVLRKTDKRRENYYNTHSNYNWDDRAGYHFMLNSGKLGIDACVRMICGFIKNEE